jgi:hypothetical protein
MKKHVRQKSMCHSFPQSMKNEEKVFKSTLNFSPCTGSDL